MGRPNLIALALLPAFLAANLAADTAALGLSEGPPLQDKATPGQPDPWHEGLALERQQNYGDAIAKFLQVLAVEPDRLGALRELGDCSARVGLDAQALFYYDRYLALVPDDAGVRTAVAGLGDQGQAQASTPTA
jgi:tetratricopeptide (TPR) repeat protein